MTKLKIRKFVSSVQLFAFSENAIRLSPRTLNIALLQFRVRVVYKLILLIILSTSFRFFWAHLARIRLLNLGFIKIWLGLCDTIWVWRGNIKLSQSKCLHSSNVFYLTFAFLYCLMVISNLCVSIHILQRSRLN